MIKLLIVAVAGFVAGILVGRRNKKKVEVAVLQGKQIIAKGKTALKKGKR